jgi:hypothetical protein
VTVAHDRSAGGPGPSSATDLLFAGIAKGPP